MSKFSEMTLNTKNLEKLNTVGKKLLKFVLNKEGRCGWHLSADLPNTGTSAGHS